MGGTNFFNSRNVMSSVGRGLAYLGTGDLMEPRDQVTMMPAPSFPPFKFEPRRARIDWRLLHGVDINSIVSRGKEGAAPCGVFAGVQPPKQYEPPHVNTGSI